MLPRYKNQQSNITIDDKMVTTKANKLVNTMWELSLADLCMVVPLEALSLVVPCLVNTCKVVLSLVGSSLVAIWVVASYQVVDNLHKWE